jgi:hypothetical protein
MGMNTGNICPHKIREVVLCYLLSSRLVTVSMYAKYLVIHLQVRRGTASEACDCPTSSRGAEYLQIQDLGMNLMFSTDQGL